MLGKKKNLGKHLAILSIAIFVNFFYRSYAADVVSLSFTTQTATGTGSSGSKISVNNNLSYWNKGDNSSIIGNYFKGYYYDDILGFFKTDWSTNSSENVRIVGSTSICPSGYGYRLGGYAYSTTMGFVDFDYNNNIFVYYCMQDKKLHGYSYSTMTGFQNFEGIGFEIGVSPTAIAVNPTGTGVFTNDTTTTTNVTPPAGQAINSNFTNNSIQTDIREFESVKETLFYIIK